jgi:hypothetical protein
MEYQKNEFCIDIGCNRMGEHSCMEKGEVTCRYSAKDFHNWLTEHGYSLISNVEQDTVTITKYRCPSCNQLISRQLHEFVPDSIKCGNGCDVRIKDFISETKTYIVQQEAVWRAKEIQL